jgi:maleylpyruvate isomerase
MKLYSYWRSSCSWRVRIALAYKRLPHDLSPVHLLRGGGEQHAREYQPLNPMAQVPTLVTDSGEVLTQSMAIVEYLEEEHPEPPLLPSAALARARARELAAIVATGIQPIQNLSVLQAIDELGGDRAAWSRRWIERGLAALEARATPGPYLAGAEPTIADVFAVPQLYNARRFGIDVAAYPAVARAEEACMKLPAFRDTRPESQPDAEPGV